MYVTQFNSNMACYGFTTDGREYGSAGCAWLLI